MYNAEIAAGSLMLPESRRIAALLLSKPSATDWNQAIRIDNILQKQTPSTAIRLARLIRNRLEPLQQDALEMISQGESEVATQMLLLAAVKHSRLVGDFMRDVVAQHIRSFQHSLSRKDWEDFFAECLHRDANVATWSETTRAKLHQVTLRILKEARYVDGTRNPRLCRVMLNSAVKCYMESHHETYARECMELYA